jgi:flagellar basal-body rod modification protein FlgD
MTTPVSGVAATGTTTAPAGTPTPTDRAALDPQAFLRLLVAQLQYQDPTNPVDTSSFMQQTATLSQVQTMDSMSSTLTSLLSAQQAQAATELIGKTVTYVDSTGLQKSGVVNSAALLSTGATLSVDGADVALSAVVGVKATSPTVP